MITEVIVGLSITSTLIHNGLWQGHKNSIHYWELSIHINNVTFYHPSLKLCARYVYKMNLVVESLLAGVIDHSVWQGPSVWVISGWLFILAWALFTHVGLLAHDNCDKIMLLLKFLPLAYHHSHFLAATLDFTSFFTTTFLGAAYFFYSRASLDLISLLFANAHSEASELLSLNFFCYSSYLQQCGKFHCSM